MVRGSYATCLFSIDPPDALAYISGWTFQGENVQRSVSLSEASWGGQVVESGEVKVDFMTVGAEVGSQIVARIGVVPRTGGIWTQAHWESKIEFVPGQGSLSCFPSQRPNGDGQLPDAYRRLGVAHALDPSGGCVAHAIHPLGTAGYALDVGSGPNEGGVYVTDATFHFKSTTRLHPGVFPGAPTYTLTDPDQAQLCRTALGLPPGSPASVNFWQYNNTCAQIPGWAGFIQALWDHEHQHFLLWETALKQEDRNIYRAVESVVRPASWIAHQAVTDQYDAIMNAAGAEAGAGDMHPSGNWTTPFWIWRNDWDNVFWYVGTPNLSPRVTLEVRP